MRSLDEVLLFIKAGISFQPLKLQKGGLPFMLTNTSTHLRELTSTNSIECESTWIEIKNNRSKNIVIASIYRHPHNFNEFFQYLENCLVKVVKENKELYICGDFNFDLLKIDSDYNTQHFFNLSM